MFKSFFVIMLFLVALLLGACTKTDSEKTALMQSAYEGDLAKVQILIRQREKINIFNPQGWSALFYAIVAEHPDVVAYMLKNGADVTVANKNGNTPMIIAATVGDPEIIKALYIHGAHVNTTNQEGITPLMAAAGAGNVNAIALLLSYGADACKKNLAQQTAYQVVEQWWGVEETKNIVQQNKSLQGLICNAKN